MKLAGKVAIVTGTSPNIGGGMVEGLAAEGAAIVAVDAVEANAVDCAAAVRAAGGKAIGITCDVTDEVQVKAAIRRAVAELGAVDILVNNAAIFNKKGVLEMSWEEWQRQSGIILGGAFLFTKYAAEAMITRGANGGPRGGVIVNIISTAGHQGEPGNVAYSTSKGGLLNFTKSTAMELVRHGIRVVSLTPTATDPTEMFERARRWGRDVEMPEGLAELMGKFEKRIPMQALPTPSDYGRALAFLVSDDAAMMTGSDLRIDAGAVARYWAWDPGVDQ
ncbi:SDR family NAD(P)-dependent oxidoreductase [Sphingomonas colocasiae]|uniref:SDR family oxidoreductase n=1 Tax=Sphingomonas colocasiae TaxID=1848973 RepID=A0ABS7PUH8_9SPHN|nr:SDR family NAD(P)-dependent oxidoreductase [Sphingomonas colocasiae]MBY8824325.1 SDR family oxidoreductase [Sphingomonas colocasiae]